ncbi:DUF3040 domain-containing protein [Streptomyces sp. NPDC091376]|uniref:DUF3040 domain-containing protein n=1 Tax=Streptomyces sp. NPDC091376 TaxID=3365994 RepID=UPI00382D5485
MARARDERLQALQEQTERTDPRFARGLGTGRPCRPKEYRRGYVRALPPVALAMLVAGLALPQGLLLAAGLVLAGLAAQLWSSPRPRGAHPRSRHRYRHRPYRP